MVQHERWKGLVYVACLFIAATLLLMSTCPTRLVTMSARYQSRHPAATVAPMMGFSADSILNVGDITDIDAFPGIGEVYANRIIEGRSVFGGYQLPTDLLLVKGIGEKRMNDILAALDEPLVEIPLGTE